MVRARELLEKIGFVEVRIARAVFAYRENNTLIALLTLHVDDGLLYGNPKNKTFDKVYNKINESLSANIMMSQALGRPNPSAGVVSIRDPSYFRTPFTSPLDPPQNTL